MRYFSLNMAGRVRNFSLPKNRPLIPLYEAVVNSLHAVEERRKIDKNYTDGKIIVRVVRSAQYSMDDTEPPQVIGFEVIDNGIGFTEDNMTSFMESDSTRKEEIGGKGVGRFSWLKAFSTIKISSTYSENGIFFNRSFVFSLKGNGIEDDLVESELKEHQTKVTMESYLDTYSAEVPDKLPNIAMRIIQHCLVYFLGENCPQIIVCDDFSESENLNKIFAEKIKTAENVESFNIENESFDLLSVKIKDKTFPGNKLFLCANNRLVDSKNLESVIVNLDEHLFERNGFQYIGVVTSDYLDKNVDMNRLSFDIPDINRSLLHVVSLNDIVDGACALIEEYLDEFLSPIADEKAKRVQKFIDEQAPQYRHLLKYKDTDIASLKPHISDEKLDDELHKIKRAFDKETKKTQLLLFDKIDKEGLALSEYEDMLQEQVERISDANTAALRDYVLHRRVILEMFERGLRKKNDGKFSLEKYMHNLIYPMRTASTEIDYESHNLWLIDEKLSYCCYISSDEPFNSKQERTDILILDKPVAMSESKNDGTEFDTIILFELKRPMRDDYSQDENPITQLYRYITRIRNNEVSDINGRKIRSGNNTKFYLYAVCDTTDSLDEIIRERDFTQTPDKLGYFGYSRAYNAYVEILSYDKILNDAKKRNRVLFDKLGI